VEVRRASTEEKTAMAVLIAEENNSMMMDPTTMCYVMIQIHSKETNF
jgi:hypothetical protein